MFSLLKKKRDEASGPNNPLPSSTMAGIAPLLQPHPPPVGAAPAETTSLATNSIASVLNPYPYSMPHATGGSYTSSPASTCPRCGKTFYETSVDKIKHHVSSCSQLDDDEDDESETSSELSEMTRSPITPAHGHLVDVDDKEEGFVPTNPFSQYEPEPVSEQDLLANGANKKNVLVNFQYGTRNHDVRPYQNPQKLFEYYNEADGHQQVDADPEDPENSAKLRFPTLAKLDDFTEFLANPEDMDELTLFKRTSQVTDILHAYQVEFDAIDKQVIAHENTIKSDAEAMQTLAKERESNKKEAEEAKSKLKEHLRISAPASKSQVTKTTARVKRREGSQENNQLDDGAADISAAADNVDVSFLRRAEDEQNRNGKPALAYTPYPDYKPTKDEELDEKRRAGRLMPAWKFNDMKTADVYGFDYNPHVKYQGAQPLMSVVNKRRGANGIEVNDTGRLRAQRQPTRKFYEENSPETEGDLNLPAKRARKPRNFEDMESTAVSRPSSRNRDRSPKRFPSGKKIGRPSRAEALAKSNLSNSMIAPSSQTPEFSQDGGSQEARGAQELADDIQDDLTSAAAGIVGSIPIKPKGKGGRPRKNATKGAGGKGKGKGKNNKGLDGNEEDEDESFGAPKTNGRRRIKNEPSNQAMDMNGFMQSTEEDDRTRQSSQEYTSRPSTSSSNMTYSTESSLRAARGKARAEQGDMTATRGSSVVDSASKRKRNAEDLIDPANSGRGKRTKTAHRPFDPLSSAEGEGMYAATQGVKHQRQDEEPMWYVPGAKKRKYASKFQEGDDQSEVSREDSIIALTGNPSLTPTTDPPAKKRRGAAKAKGEVPIDQWVRDDRSEDGRHLSLILDPAERELVRKRRVKRGKSDKLSMSMRARWTDGRMNAAMETRKANAAKKKEEEKVTITNPQPDIELQPQFQPQPEQMVAAPSVPKTVVPNPSPATKLVTAQRPITSIKIKKGKGKTKEDTEEDAIYDESEADEDTPAPPPVSTRRMSTRERKRPARVLALDGTMEDESEVQRQFKSEYDRYQALTSPGTPIRLGKRVRKQINFAEPAGGSDEDEYF